MFFFWPRIRIGFLILSDFTTCTRPNISQHMWQLNIEWDKPLTESLIGRWKTFYQELKDLSTLPTPRKFILSLSLEVEIYGFSDEFEEAPEAAINVRSINEMICRASRLHWSLPKKTSWSLGVGENEILFVDGFYGGLRMIY